MSRASMRIWKSSNPLVRQLRQPQYYYLQGVSSRCAPCFEGRFTDAEQLALEALTLGQRLQLESAEGIFGMQMFHVASRAGSSARGRTDC